MKMKTPSVSCRALFAGDAVLQAHGIHHIVLAAEDLFHHSIPGEANLLVVVRSLLQLYTAAQFVTAMNDIHAVGEARQEDGFFQCRIAAANDNDILSAEEESIAGAAIADAGADVLLFAGDAQLARIGADRHYDRSPPDTLRRRS